MIDRVIRIETRGSTLAMIQAGRVATGLVDHGLGSEIVVVHTAGDQGAQDTAGRHMRAVPGRRTDVKDAEWIADLLRHGLLRGSVDRFRYCRASRAARPRTRRSLGTIRA